MCLPVNKVLIQRNKSLNEMLKRNASNTNENLFTRIYFYVANFYANVLVNKRVYISDEDDFSLLFFCLLEMISWTKISVS